MLRTLIITRNELVKSAVKRNVRNQVARGLSSECVRRRHQQRILTQNKLEARPLIWNQYTVRGFADYPPHTPVNLPALSPTMETGTIISWAKKEGDKLNEGDLLAEIETDKATMGFETPEEGYLAKILVPAGSKDVPIGKLVCIITENQDDVAKFKDYVDTGAPSAPPKSKSPSPPPEPKPVAAAAPAPQPVPTPVVAAPPPQEGGRVYASPMAKRLAEIRNVRLQGKGSGIFGSIKAADVGAGGAPAVTHGVEAAAATVQGPATARYTDTPISNIRAVIAKRLTESKVTIPHYYLSKDVNVEKLLAFRAEINKQLEKQKVKVSINDFVIKAVAAASARVPEMNSAWLGNVIRQYHGVDVSVAVSTSKGLITPIVFDADRKGVIQISKDMKILATKARENKLVPAEFQGGTITVSNLGMFDVPVFAAIINPPQAGILAVGSLAKRVIPAGDGQFKEAPFITVTLSADHRVADGAVGAQWLKVLADNLADPGNICL